MPDMPRDLAAAKDLLVVLEAFGAQHSNPVLTLLQGQVPQAKQKFPEREMQFGGDRWRAFYHCHEAPNKDPREHGHFHVFAHTGLANDVQRDWSHIVALSIDFDGQPLTWFTVNQWVTGGAWRPAAELTTYLQAIVVPQSMTLVEHWLLTLMRMYATDISTLLLERDRAITRLAGSMDWQETLTNRDSYELSARPVQLEARLSALLADQGR